MRRIASATIAAAQLAAAHISPALLASAVLASACTRSFDLPGGARSPGTPCESDAQCESSACSDGVCCAVRCAASESCAVPGHLGSCAARAQGSPCSANGQCPSGHCADKVCCDTACAGTCQSCRADALGAPGTCHGAPPNSDARSECGLCSACFQGICAPALPGTDPGQRCPRGEVCGVSQACGAPAGGACATDADCAQGTCFSRRCAQLAVEHVFAEPMVATASGRTLLGVAGSPGGGVALLFGEYSADPSGGLLESDLFLALRSPEGTWTATDLYVDRLPNNGALTSAVSFLGPTAYVLAFDHEASDGACDGTGPAPCGVFGVLVSPGGLSGRPEVVDADVRFNSQVALLRDDQGRLLAAYDGEKPGGTTQIFLRRRDVGAAGVTWTQLGAIDPARPSWSSVTWSAALPGASPVIFLADAQDGPLEALALPPAAPDVAVMPAGFEDCQPDFPTARALDARRVSLSVVCGRQVLAGTWDATQHFQLALVDGALRVDPLGLSGGAPALAVFTDSTDAPVVTDAHVRLQGTSPEDHLVFHPRGTSDIGTGQVALDAEGLPLLGITTGPRSGAAVSGLELYLARFHH